MSKRITVTPNLLLSLANEFRNEASQIDKCTSRMDELIDADFNTPFAGCYYGLGEYERMIKDCYDEVRTDFLKTKQLTKEIAQDLEHMVSYLDLFEPDVMLCSPL